MAKSAKPKTTTATKNKNGNHTAGHLNRVVMALIDDEGADMKKSDYADALEEIADDCKTRAEAVREEIAAAGESGDDNDSDDDDADDHLGGRGITNY